MKKDSTTTKISFNIPIELKKRTDIYIYKSFLEKNEKITMTDIILKGIELYFKTLKTDEKHS